MFEPFAQPDWVDAQEMISADVVHSLARLAGWLRRRANLESKTPAVTSHRRTGRQWRNAPAPDARQISAAAQHSDGASRQQE